MEGNLYNHIKMNNLTRDPLLDSQDESFSLSNLIHKKSLNDKDLVLIIKSFCGDLKSILKLSDLREVISSVFKLENHVFLIREKWSSDESLLPALGDFYKALSPMLLRAIWEYNESYFKEDDLNKKLMESLRVSLEEELYYWQEQADSLQKPIL